jgi:hypothetical protein
MTLMWGARGRCMTATSAGEAARVERIGQVPMANRAVQQEDIGAAGRRERPPARTRFEVADAR